MIDAMKWLGHIIVSKTANKRLKDRAMNLKEDIQQQLKGGQG